MTVHTFEIDKDATDQSVDVFIQDSSDGTALTGLAYNTTDLTCYYRRGATGTVTQLTLATQTVGGAHSDGGFVELDSTNMPGQYRLDLSDAIVATGVDRATVVLAGASSMQPCQINLTLLDVIDSSNPISADVASISGDSTAADNLEAACDGTGYNIGGGSVVAASISGVTFPTNFGDLSITATTGRVDVASIEGSDATDQINAACDTALTDYDALVPADLPSNFASLVISAGGIVDSNVEQINGNQLTGGGATAADYA